LTLSCLLLPLWLQAPDLKDKKRADIKKAGFDESIAKPVSLQAFRALNLKPVPRSV